MIKLTVPRALCSLWFLVGLGFGIVRPAINGTTAFVRKQLRTGFGRRRDPEELKRSIRVLSAQPCGALAPDFVELKTVLAQADTAVSDGDTATLCEDEATQDEKSNCAASTGKVKVSLTRQSSGSTLITCEAETGNQPPGKDSVDIV
jgi:hypothetical protein